MSILRGVRGTGPLRLKGIHMQRNTFKYPSRAHNRGALRIMLDTVVAKTEASGYFPPGDPIVLAYAQAVKAFDDALTRLVQSERSIKSEGETLRAAEAAIKAAEPAFFGHVMAVIGNDPAKIAAIGLLPIPSKAKRAPAPVAQPTALVLITTKQPGELRVRFHSVKRSKGYQLFRADTFAGPYNLIAQMPRCRITLENQGPGQRYYRVRAIGLAGAGPMSDPLMVDFGASS